MISVDNQIFNYREVIPDQSQSEGCKEIFINTGGTQSVLQDIKLSEKSGGYGYIDASRSSTRNRFIVWRINHDVLELTEHSLDLNLYGFRVKYKFLDTPITDGCSITETEKSVILLICTVCSVHKLEFPHPNTLQEENVRNHPDFTAPSIFADVSSNNLSKNHSSYFLNYAIPQTTVSYFSEVNEKALFAFAYKSGPIVLIQEVEENGKFSVLELSHDNLVSKFFTNFAGILRGKSDASAALSLSFITIEGEIFLLAVCQDFQLRIWSTNKSECLFNYKFLSDRFDSSKLVNFNAQNIMIKKSINSTRVKFVIFVSIDQENQYIVIRPDFVDNDFRMTHLKSISSFDQDVIDFVLEDNRLWVVWRTLDNQTRLSTVQIALEESISWVSVVLEPNHSIESFAFSNPDLDPKQAYVSQIFYRGRFPKSVVLKTLSLYKKFTGSVNVILTTNQLRRKVCLAIEEEIQDETKGYEINDQEYLEISIRCWSKFYSCCVQYLIAASKPIGIFLLPSVSGAILIKKSFISFLRPMEQIEYMVLCSNMLEPGHFEGLNSQNDGQDLIHLITMLNYIEKNLSDDYKVLIDKNLSHFQHPEDIFNAVMKEYIDIEDDNNSKTLSTFISSFSTAKNICKMIEGLLKLIDVCGHEDEDEFILESVKLMDAKKQKIMVLNGLFSSKLGVSFVCEALNQFLIFRFSTCRNLLYLQMHLLKDTRIIENVSHQNCISQTIKLMQAYYANVWLCEQSSMQTIPSEKSKQTLAALKLSNLYSNSKCLENITLLIQQFTMTCANFNIYLKNDIQPHWNHSLLQYLNRLNTLIWPIESSLLLEEWMLANGQYVWLQNYCQQINCWNYDNYSSRSFLTAVSYLAMTDSLKSYHLFQKVSNHVITEPYMVSKIADSNTPINVEKVQFNYFLKVISLLELYGARDFAIKMADLAINLHTAHKSDLAILFSIQFNHNLILGHYKCAYECMFRNPDKDRYKDCLRQFIKTLIENQEIQLFLSFSFGDMTEDVEEILHSRAKVIDTTLGSVYYNVLYAFYMKSRRFWNAGNIMYEQAVSLSNYDDIDGLQNQINYYLGCINILNIVEENQAFVLKPVLKFDDGKHTNDSRISFAKDNDKTNEGFDEGDFSNHIETIDLLAVRKEYELQNAKLTLAKWNRKKLISCYTKAEEVVPLLTSENLFTSALKLCEYYNVNKRPVFEQLVILCTRLDKENNQNAWNYLIENDLSDLKTIDSSPAKVCWDLLRKLIDKYQPEYCTEIIQVVARKLVSLNIQVPQWIIKPYKKRNAAELIRVYTDEGRLCEASFITLEYIWTALGHFNATTLDQYSLKQSLAPQQYPLCLPINTFEYLLNKVFVEAKKDAKYEKLFNKLYGTVEFYVKKCQQINEM